MIFHLAASALPALVMARGHRVDGVNEVCLFVALFMLVNAKVFERILIEQITNEEFESR